MGTSTIPTLVQSLVDDLLGVLGDVAPVVLTAFAVLLGLGFGIYLFRKFVWRKKV